MNNPPDNLPEPRSQIVLYQTEDGKSQIQVRLENETVWLTQKLMAELFQKDVRTINEHILNIFEEGELRPDSVIRKFRITADDGKTYETNHYNLDVIISVGYRVKSQRGTRFRMWATERRMPLTMCEKMLCAVLIRTAAEGEMETINDLPVALLRRAFNGDL